MRPEICDWTRGIGWASSFQRRHHFSISFQFFQMVTSFRNATVSFFMLKKPRRCRCSQGSGSAGLQKLRAGRNVRPLSKDRSTLLPHSTQNYANLRCRFGVLFYPFAFASPRKASWDRNTARWNGEARGDLKGGRQRGR